MTDKHSFKWGYLLIAITLSAIGICLISLHDMLKALAISIGIILIITGAAVAVVAIAKRSRGFGFAVRIFYAAMLVIGGTVTAIFNGSAAEILIALLALMLIIDASFKLHTAAMSKRFSLPLWWINLSLALLVIAGSFVMIKFPPEGLATASVILGIILIADAVANLLSAFYVSAYESRQYGEAYRKFRTEEQPSEDRDSK